MRTSSDINKIGDIFLIYQYIMNNVFISGIPASGKSYLADKISKLVNCLHVDVDSLRDKMIKDHNLELWVNFFQKKDEQTYWETITVKKHWRNLVKQSEAFWPTILTIIKKTQITKQPAIFEGVNILPHLAHRDLNFPGIVLLGESKKTIFERLKRDPRWGKVTDLQRIEAQWFLKHEGNLYKKEAKKYGYKTFYNNNEAKEEILRLL